MPLWVIFKTEPILQLTLALTVIKPIYIFKMQVMLLRLLTAAPEAYSAFL